VPVDQRAGLRERAGLGRAELGGDGAYVDKLSPVREGRLTRIFDCRDIDGKMIYAVLVDAEKDVLRPIVEKLAHIHFGAPVNRGRPAQVDQNLQFMQGKEPTARIFYFLFQPVRVD